METVTAIMQLILAWLTVLGICLGLAQVIRSGYLFLTARGNGEQIAEAKNILWYSVVGTAIIAGAYALIVLERVYL